MLTWWIGASNALRTRETLKIMQGQVRGFLEAEVHFFSSFYSIAAMDGQTADHIQQVICKYTRDEILTVMWVILTPISFFIITIYAWGILYLIIVDTPGKWNHLFILKPCLEIRIISLSITFILTSEYFWVCIWQKLCWGIFIMSPNANVHFKLLNRELYEDPITKFDGRN